MVSILFHIPKELPLFSNALIKVEIYLIRFTNSNYVSLFSLKKLLKINKKTLKWPFNITSYFAQNDLLIYKYNIHTEKDS